MGVADWGKWLLSPVPLGTSLPLATWAWTLVFTCYHSVRKTAFFFSELVKMTTSSLIIKCNISFLLGHSVIGYPCFASYSYPQKHGRKKKLCRSEILYRWLIIWISSCLPKSYFFFLCRFIQSQRSMTRMLIAVPRPSLMLIPVTGLLNESLCR